MPGLNQKDRSLESYDDRPVSAAAHRSHHPDNLIGAEKDLYELACLSGILVDEQVFKIVIDLLRMQVSPTAVVRMLRGIGATRIAKKSDSAAGTTHAKDRTKKSKPKS